MQVPAAWAGDKPIINRRMGIRTMPPPIPSKPPSTPAKAPVIIRIMVTVHRKFLQKVQNVKIGNLRFCLRCGKNSVCKTKMTLSSN